MGSLREKITIYMSSAAFLERRQNPPGMEGRCPQGDLVRLGLSAH